MLDTRKAKKNGTFPIKLAVSHKSKTSYLLAKISIPEKYRDNERIKRLISCHAFVFPYFYQSKLTGIKIRGNRAGKSIADTINRSL
ncbi:Arm DNA-binding domain-containing protein [Ancylomarina longa]|uniref:Arm DNA-binding domain-containing protein n=1 Tax=Ancylomarina longa TaxID=2487017 RepID=A0A434AYS2_9BACT|nr:hypothetical protein DLK05_03115 [Ancylomarina longa]